MENGVGGVVMAVNDQIARLHILKKVPRMALIASSDTKLLALFSAKPTSFN